MKITSVFLVLSAFVLLAIGCASKQANKSDAYVPWWVQDGVPNADGTVVNE